jgi:hypothetical protein
MLITAKSTEAMQKYIEHNGHFIDVLTIDKKDYYHVFKKYDTHNLESKANIYHQIVQQENIELHKLSKIICNSLFIFLHKVIVYVILGKVKFRIRIGSPTQSTQRQKKTIFKLKLDQMDFHKFEFHILFSLVKYKLFYIYGIDKCSFS